MAGDLKVRPPGPRPAIRHAPLGVIVAPTGNASADETDVAAGARNLKQDLYRQFVRLRCGVGEREGIVAGLQDQGGDTDVRDELSAAAACIVIIHTIEAMQRRRDLVIEQAKCVELSHVDAQWGTDACKLAPVGIPADC